MTRLVGYSRELTANSGVASDVEVLRSAGARKVFSDVIGSDRPARPELLKCLAGLQSGDVLVTSSSSRLSHSVAHFTSTITDLTERGVGYRSLTEPALCTEGGANAVSAEVIVAIEVLRRRLVGLRTRDGMTVAASEGRRAGRPTVMTEQRLEIALELRRHDRSVVHIARVLGVSVSAVRRALNAIPAGDRPSLP